MSNESTQDPAFVKSFCANLYAHPLVNQILGDSFHPGGTALTERVGHLLHLGPSTRVLDVASGRGTSAIHLAKVFGCSVVGVDLSSANTQVATTEAALAHVDHLVSFVPGDAESLPFDSGGFDAIICECALCTFPDKPTALKEFWRVLKPAGLVGISDLTRSNHLSQELQGLLAWVACIAEALPSSVYLELLNQAGFCNDCDFITADEALQEMVATIQKNLISAKIMKGLGKLSLPEGVDLDEAVKVARSARLAIEAKQLGYGVFIGKKKP